MFQSSWPTVIGLVLEISGLACLFFELLTTRRSAIAAAQFRADQEDVDATIRDLVLTITKSQAALVDFLRGYLSLLELEADFRRDPKKFESVDSQMAELFSNQDEHSLRRHAVLRFNDAAISITGSDAIERAFSHSTAARLVLLNILLDAQAEARRLAVIVRIGVGLVLLGAITQLADLMI